MNFSVIGYQLWQNLWQKKGFTLVVSGFGAGAIFTHQEFINPALWLRDLKTFKQSDWVDLFSWLPPWLVQTLITLVMVWVGLWMTRYLVKRIIQPKLEPDMRRWVHRLDPRAIPLRPERRETLRRLITSPINLIALVVAGLFGLAHFIGWTNVTLLTGAFGLASAPLLRDLQNGMHIVLEDTFDIGERVQIGDTLTRIEGIVESINLRTTSIRAPGGELYAVPHGEIRIVRNYSRGDFALTSLMLKVTMADLASTLAHLNELSQEAVALLPNLVEPWQVSSGSGVIRQHARLTVLAKARFGQTEALRLELMALIQQRLAEAGITLID
jgi:small conductance mechanosensitive channel